MSKMYNVYAILSFLHILESDFSEVPIGACGGFSDSCQLLHSRTGRKGYMDLGLGLHLRAWRHHDIIIARIRYLLSCNTTCIRIVGYALQILTTKES